MNIVLVAAPAAGKGTISTILNKKYGLACVSAGELLRGVDPETTLGKAIREIQSKGLLVNDDVTNKLIEERLEKKDSPNGYILDGYPRRVEQVYALEDMENRLGIKIDYAVYLKVDYETALKRTIGRRICPNCKKTYNILTGSFAPLEGETCDYCHVPLTKRNDDNEESLKVRFDFFNQNTMPVVEYYRKKGNLIELDASKDAEELLKDLEKSLGVCK